MIKNVIPAVSGAVSALALAAVMTVTNSDQAMACSADSEYLGSVCFTAIDFCPEGYVAANGQLLQVNANQALFALLGNVFGGDGRSTFAVPDLRGRAPVGAGVTPWNVNIPRGLKRGQETVTLLPSQMAPHNHTATFTPSGGSTSPATAQGTVSLPFTANANLPVSVSGSVKIASSTATGQQAVANNAVLGKGGLQATIYSPTATADTNIGPTQTFTGTASGTLNSTATGNISIPVTGGQWITGGDVTVGVFPSNQTPVATLSPQMGLTACINAYGIFPQRP